MKGEREGGREERKMESRRMIGREEWCLVNSSVFCFTTHSSHYPRHFNEMASGRTGISSPVSYSPSPTRRSLSPSPAFLNPGVGYIPSPQLRGRTQSFGSSPQHQQQSQPQPQPAVVVPPATTHGMKQHVSVWVYTWWLYS